MIDQIKLQTTLIRLLEAGHTRTQCLKVADHVGNNPARFKALVEVYLSGPYRITQRASWPIGVCGERHPELITPHLKRLLKFAATPGVHDAVKRNTMRILQFAALPKRFEGEVLNLAYTFLQNRKEPIAVRVFALTVIDNIIREMPDLQREFKILIQDELPLASAAFRSRGFKILRKLP